MTGGYDFLSKEPAGVLQEDGIIISCSISWMERAQGLLSKQCARRGLSGIKT